MVKRGDRSGQEPSKHVSSCQCLDCTARSPPPSGLTWSKVAFAPIKVADAFFGNLPSVEDEMRSFFHSFRSDIGDESGSQDGVSSLHLGQDQQMYDRNFSRNRGGQQYPSYVDPRSRGIRAEGRLNQDPKIDTPEDVDTTPWEYQCEPSIPAQKTSRRRSTQYGSSSKKP